ncbi:MAG: hypothetical protein RLY31_1797 [Bacteroidota bacterium]|jgi:trk system potassium uptake protein TrkA
MKFIIIGLGNFGASLGLELADMGHEVLGVDRNMEKVELLKHRLPEVQCLDTSQKLAHTNLPIDKVDVVIVTIGEDEGGSILTTALVIKGKPKRLIGRSISDLHTEVLKAMGVQEIIHPEQEAAKHLAQSLSDKSVIDSFEISDDYAIYEIKVPTHLVGRTIGEVDFRNRYEVNIVTIIRNIAKENILGMLREKKESIGIVRPEEPLLQDDVLVVFCNRRSLARLQED